MGARREYLASWSFLFEIGSALLKSPMRVYDSRPDSAQAAHLRKLIKGRPTARCS